MWGVGGGGAGAPYRGLLVRVEGVGVHRCELRAGVELEQPCAVLRRQLRRLAATPQSCAGRGGGSGSHAVRHVLERRVNKLAQLGKARAEGLLLARCRYPDVGLEHALRTKEALVLWGPFAFAFLSRCAIKRVSKAHGLFLEFSPPKKRGF